MLNLNGSLTKAGVAYSSLWSGDFRTISSSAACAAGSRRNAVEHDTSHVRPLERVHAAAARGKDRAACWPRICAATRPSWACSTKAAWACTTPSFPMSCCIPPASSRSGSASRRFMPRCSDVSDDEARAVRAWLDARGMQFRTGADPETELTDAQILEQCKMYIAAMRIADEFGCDAIGIQYQQGLKDLAPASDLAEGLLNNVDRPPVRDRANGRVLYENQALPHFNEVDECAGLDALVTNRIWTPLGLRPGNHAARRALWRDLPVTAPRSSSGSSRSRARCRRTHFIGGYAGAVSERQPPMYFRLGGGTLKGVSKPGEIVWSRIFVDSGALKADMGRAKVVELPPRGNRAALADHHAAVAHHARRDLRHHARPDDGAAQVQPHAGGLCAGCRRAPTWRWPPKPPRSARWAWKSASAAPRTGCYNPRKAHRPERGEIGRRAGFRFQWPKGREGSSPFSGTKIFNGLASSAPPPMLAL